MKLHHDRKRDHDERARKDERDQREEHLHRCFHRKLLGAREAFGAPLLGLRAQDGAEVHAHAFGLDQGAHRLPTAGSFMRSANVRSASVRDLPARTSRRMRANSSRSGRRRATAHGLFKRAAQVQARFDAQRDDVEIERQLLQQQSFARVDAVLQPDAGYR